MRQDSTTSLVQRVLFDTAALSGRLQNTLTFQIASTLQKILFEFLDPWYALACVLLSCWYVRSIHGLLDVDMHIFKSILLALLGQLGMTVIDATLLESAASTYTTFLLRTGVLCVPTVLGAISPLFLDNEYVQTSLSVLLFAYAQGSENTLRGIDFGVPLLYICILVLMLSHRAAAFVASSHTMNIFLYVFRGWRMLLLDLLLNSLQQQGLWASVWSKLLISFGLLLAIDVIGLTSWNIFNDLRGYTLYKTASHFISLNTLSFDSVSHLGVCVLFICTRSIFAQIHPVLHSQALVHATNSLGDVLFVASVNILLTNAVRENESGPVTVRLLSVFFLCTLVYYVQNMLQKARGERVAAQAS